MNDLPRSRALVRLDGPGHIMPVEPVTPPGSRVLRVVHVPPVLAAIAFGLLFVAALALNLLGAGMEALAGGPGVRLLSPLIGAAAIAALYYAYVRLVERRAAPEEVAAGGWWREAGAGAVVGAVLSLATFGVLMAAGAAQVVGANPARLIVVPVVVQGCTAVIAEIILCGLGFRLLERLLGSWLALLAGMAVVGAVGFVVNQGAPNAAIAGLAAAMEAALLFAAPYMLTRRLWAGIGLYAARRVAQVMLYGTAMSDTGPRGWLVTLLGGPDWLTGGRGGPEASLPALLFGTVAVIAALVMTVRQGRLVRPAWRRGRTA